MTISGRYKTSNRKYGEHRHEKFFGGQSDEQVICCILDGQMRLYEVRVRRYNARFFRIGMSLLNDDADVADVMQKAYIKAYEHLPDFEGRASFGTWLTRTFIDEALLFQKQKKRRDMIQNLVYSFHLIHAKGSFNAFLPL